MFGIEEAALFKNNNMSSAYNAIWCLVSLNVIGEMRGCCLIV